MIIESIMNIMKSFILFIIGLFPELPDTSMLFSLTEPLREVLTSANMFIDVGVVCSCVLILLVVYNIGFLWSVVMWVVRKIPLGVS